MSVKKQDRLADWVRSNPDLYRWDSITGLALQAGNTVLRQTHAAHLSRGDEISGISGQLDIDMTSITYHFADFQLSGPQVAVGRVSYENARLDMMAKLHGGTLVKAEQPYKVLSLSLHDALDSLELRQQVRLHGKDGELVLDLSQGEDVRLALSDYPAEQLQAGAWLQQQLPTEPEKLDYPMLAGPRDVPEQTLRALHLGTQADAQGNGDTLVVFASSQYGSEGEFPGDNSGFPRLLPTPPKASDAAELMSSMMLHRNAFITGFKGLLSGARFDDRYEAGQLVGVVAEEGQFQVPTTRYHSQDYEFEGQPFMLNATGGLEARFEQDWASQHWVTGCEIKFSCLRKGDEVPSEYKVTFELSLHHRFYLLASTEPEQGWLEGQFFSPWPEVPEARVVDGLPGNVDKELKDQVADFAAYTVKRAILLGMAQKLDPASPERWLQGLQFGAFGTLLPVTVEFPGAMSVSGTLGTAAFSILDDEVKVRAGLEHEFEVENPEQEVLTWTLEALADGPTHPGTINNGKYRAPPAHTLQGRSGQVLVIASNAAGERSVAVVTVLPRALAANPFITTIQAGTEQLLSAGALGSAPLDWKKVNEDPEQSGELTVEAGGRRCRYQAKAATPRQSDTYWLEQIEVQQEGTDEKQALHVLVLKRMPGLLVALAEQPQDNGSMQFVASVNGRQVDAKWALAVGTGSIDPDTGLYEPAPSGEQAPGILVFATFDSGDLGVFEGHQIMPLQVTRFKGLSNQLLMPQARAL